MQLLACTDMRATPKLIAAVDRSAESFSSFCKNMPLRIDIDARVGSACLSAEQDNGRRLATHAATVLIRLIDAITTETAKMV